MKKILAFACLCALLLPLCACSRQSFLAKPLPEPLSRIRTQQASEFLFDSAEFTSVGADGGESFLSCDLDLDGEDELISLLTLQKNGKRRAELCVFRMYNGQYRRCAAVRNTCDEIADLAFARLAQDVQAIVVGWGLHGEDSRGISVCTLSGQGMQTLYSGHYNALAVSDFDGDGFDEILLARAGTDSACGSAVLLDHTDGALAPVSRVWLSAGLDRFLHAQAAPIGFEQTALICEGYIEGMGYVSDYLVCVGQTLINVFLSDHTGVSTQTLRDEPIWSCDIDGNGYVELPIPREAPHRTGETDAYALRFIDWMQCGDAGLASLVCTTYHDFEDEWYLILPQNMSENIGVEISLDAADCKASLFSYWSDEGERTLPIWEVYVFRGDDALERMRQLSFEETAAVYPKAYSVFVYNHIYGFSYSRRSLAANFHACAAPEPAQPYAALFAFPDAQQE